MLYFWRIGQFVIEALRLESAGKGLWIKSTLLVSFVQIVLAQLLSLAWWLYPAIKFLKDEKCSNEFLAAVNYMYYFFRSHYFFNGLIMIQVLHFVNI